MFLGRISFWTTTGASFPTIGSFTLKISPWSTSASYCKPMHKMKS